MTSQYHDHGITVTEISPLDQPMRWSDVSTAAFVGRALRGPLNTPVLIDSFAAFTRRFGGRWHHSTLSDAVEQFFVHGGQRLYVVRIANAARGAVLSIPGEHGALSLQAIEPGSSEILRASIDYDGIVDHAHFNLIVQRLSPETRLVVDQEIFTGVCCDASATTFIGNALADSALVRICEPLPAGRPCATMGPSADSRAPYVLPASRGSDGVELSDYDLVGSARRGTGLFSLDAIDDLDLVYLPPPTPGHDLGPAALLAAELFCRKHGAMLVMDPPAHWHSAAEAADAVTASGLASPHLLTYFPRVSCDAGVRPAGAALAGLLCKLDARTGPWTALGDAGYSLARGRVPQYALDEREQQLLRRHGINTLVTDSDGRPVFRGDLTLAHNAQLDILNASLPLKRFSLKLAKTIEKATCWAVFEQDRDLAAARVERQVEGLLRDLGRRDAICAAGVRCRVQRGTGRAGNEQGVTVLLTLQAEPDTAPLSLTLYQSATGSRITGTAFAPAEPIQGARIDAA